MSSHRRRLLLGLPLVTLAALAAYLLAWPIDLTPENWQPPAAKSWPLNDALAGASLFHPELLGAEAITLDAEGRLVTGLLDGRVVRFAADGSGDVTTLANTGGRPLGLKYDSAGLLIVADAYKGLLALHADGRVETLATEHGGKPFLFTDDLDIGADGTIYFTDASSRWPYSHFLDDILEHQPWGRLLSYHPQHGVKELLGGLYFANGVALSEDGSYVLVAETSSYRVRRVWLTGSRTGNAEVFIDNLPGFPDNITWSPTRRAFWIAVGTPRDATVDALAGRPFLRKVVARLPEALRPAPKQHAFALAVDEQGRVVADLQHVAPDAYAPIASVLEKDGFLYLGSFQRTGVGRLKAP